METKLQLATSPSSTSDTPSVSHLRHYEIDQVLPAFIFQTSFYDPEYQNVFRNIFENQIKDNDAYIEQILQKGAATHCVSTKILGHHAFGYYKLINNQYDDALVSFEIALELARTNDNHLAIASIGFDSIRACLKLHLWEQAHKTLQEIQHLYQELDLVDEKIYAMIQLCRFHRLLGNVREAQKVVNLARNILTSFSEYSSFDNKMEHYFLIKLTQAQIEKKLKNFEKSLEISSSLLELLDKEQTQNFSPYVREYYQLALYQVQEECNLDLHYREKSYSVLTHLKKLTESKQSQNAAERLHHFKMAHEFFFENKHPSTEQLIPDLELYSKTDDLEFCLDESYRILKKCHESGLLENNETLLNFYHNKYNEIANALPAELRQPFEEYYEFRQGVSLKTSPHYLMKKIIEFSRELICEYDPEILSQKSLKMVSEFTGLQRGFVLLLDSPTPRIAATLNVFETDLVRDRGSANDCLYLAKRVLQNGHPFIQTTKGKHDIHSIHETEKSILRRMGRTEFVILPLSYNGDGIAVIYLDDAVTVDHEGFSPEILENLATVIASAMNNAYRLSSKDRDLKTVKKMLDKQQHDGGEHKFSFENFIGISAKKRELFDVLQKSLDSTATITLTGESGVGKEMVSKIIHFNGVRRKQSFVALNCAAIPDNLLESELFGYVKGAFTDAREDKEGLFVKADGGTLFLDEIGEMPLAMQVKIIRALQEREVLPIGASKPIKIDVRIICATNRNLQEMIKRGEFREDLYYRINVINIGVPSVRERREDIPLLVDHALRMYAIENNVPQKTISSLALKYLMRYTWPGNVRELINVMYNLSIFVEHNCIELSDLEDRKELFRAPVDFDKNQTDPLHFDLNELSEKIDNQKLTLADAKHEFEKMQILRALQICDNQITSASYHLQMPRPQVSRLVKKYGIKKRKGDDAEDELDNETTDQQDKS